MNPNNPIDGLTEDPYRKIAAEVFNKAPNAVTPDERRMVKYHMYLDTYAVDLHQFTQALRQDLSFRRGYPWQRKLKRLHALQKARKAARGARCVAEREALLMGYNSVDVRLTNTIHDSVTVIAGSYAGFIAEDLAKLMSTIDLHPPIEMNLTATSCEVGDAWAEAVVKAISPE